MKNTYAYRYFLFINYLANNMVGMTFLNFAELLKSEEEGRFMNRQMTSYFLKLDQIFSELIGNDPDWIFEELNLGELALIPAETLKNHYLIYCYNNAEFLKFQLD